MTRLGPGTVRMSRNKTWPWREVNGGAGLTGVPLACAVLSCPVGGAWTKEKTSEFSYVSQVRLGEKNKVNVLS